MILVIMVKYEYKVYEKLYHESLQKKHRNLSLKFLIKSSCSIRHLDFSYD